MRTPSDGAATADNFSSLYPEAGQRTLSAWDGYKAYLFDIDGTLLNCADAVHYFAFCEALGMLAGRPLNLDGVVTHGSVDEAIVRDALVRAGVPEAVWRPRLPEARELMGRFVEAREGDLQPDVLPGVVEVLGHLRGRGAVLGVATGNLAAIGRAKLRRAGLLEWFDFGGYSDGLATRRAVFAAALELAGAGKRVCVVGDTPEDVRAAKACGVAVVGVATGIFSVGELRAEGADLVVGTLGELLEMV